jgi:photosystem II stability/assembly factor-like uncharacterized protein
LKRLLTLCSGFFLAIFCLSYFELPVSQKEEESALIHGEERENGPAEFAKFHRDIRTAEGESKPGYKPGYKLKELRKAKEVARRFSARAKSNGVTAWTERGPANVPGRTRGIIVDPDDASKNTWFAGSVGGGIWKTTNAGQSWTNKTPDLPNLSTGVLAMAASNSNVIYCGTGEGFFNIGAVDGTGIFKSTDKGENWSQLNSTIDFPDVNRIAIDPTNANIVLAATNGGIYRSVDGGNVWTEVLNENLIQDLKVNPTNFNIQYAAQNSVGVWRSTDAGVTWTLSNTNMGPLGRVEIAVSPANPNRIFASAEKDSFEAGSVLLVSSDGAQTWSFINVSIGNAEVDFLNAQGWYDNTIACDPFNQNSIYFGGVDLFQLTIGSGSSTVEIYNLEEDNTKNTIALTPFTGATNGNFDLGDDADAISIEVRFGPGKSQKAHRFMVPTNAGADRDGGAGVPATQYQYQDYVDVPFEVWDITNNRQLMASFRDQGRDGSFNLISANTTSTPTTLHAREYLYVNNFDYSATTPNATIAATGGQERKMMFNFWPTLAEGGTWPPSEEGTLRITASIANKLNATTTNITDGRGTFGNGKNAIVHVDHHNIVMIPMTATTYKIINANDGGVFVSNTSATPGINNGNWTATGNGYNSSQFYGADKKAGADEYFGGMQDNGTWLSPSGQSANATTNYLDKIAGDGFEVIWHNRNTQLLIGGSQFNGFERSTDGGANFVSATSGLGPQTEMPFISKLANSRALPDRLFTLGLKGVFVSRNFGQNWSLTPITEKWGSSSAMDVDVSRANANIVWAGAGMNSDLNLHVSTDGGTTFNLTNNFTDVTMGGITKLASHPTEDSTAYAIFSLSGKPKILKTTDLGISWVDISGFGTNTVSASGFPDVAVYCLYVRPDNTDIIWAGTDIGIIETQDGGTSWVILEDFPNVAVWDMKGMDNQIVIATHGRGIWTATTDALQTDLPTLPQFTAAGTSPEEVFKVALTNVANIDSIQLFFNTSYVGSLAGNELAVGQTILEFSNVSFGQKTITGTAYIGDSPFSLNIISTDHLNLNPPANSYSDYFANISNFKTSGFQLSSFSGQSNAARKTLHTPHPYTSNATFQASLLVPIVVSSSNATFSYRDVAIVEPVNDSVVVEATKDGVNWIALEPAYDASANANWLTTFNAAAPNNVGKYDQMVSHTIDLLSKFAADDKVLFRFRLASNATVNAWGWAIDYVAIQEEPTDVEYAAANSLLSLYPNPTAADATLKYALTKPSDVFIELTSVQGKRISLTRKGLLPVGEYSEAIKTANLNAGIYVVVIRKADSTESIRLVVK